MLNFFAVLKKAREAERNGEDFGEVYRQAIEERRALIAELEESIAILTNYMENGITTPDPDEEEA